MATAKVRSKTLRFRPVEFSEVEPRQALHKEFVALQQVYVKHMVSVELIAAPMLPASSKDV
jgi:hypothetical protein